MPFSKTIISLILSSIAFTSTAETTNVEKAKATVKAQEKKAKSMMGKYGQNLHDLIPESKKEKSTNHNTESFIDKQSAQFKKIEKELSKKGMLDGFNEDGNAQHIDQKLPKGFMQNQKEKLEHKLV